MTKQSEKNKEKYIQYIYFGRLAQEKGRDILLHTRNRLIQEHKQNINTHMSQLRFLICGDGPYRQQIMHLSKQHPNIHYLGRKNRETLEQYIAASDYTLMPSRFLETFGMTALESLSLGVPVIANNKGGTKQFVRAELALDENKQQSLENQLYDIIVQTSQNTDINKKKEQCEWALKTAHSYHPTQWKKTLYQSVSIPKHSKILLISDYQTKLYGIETHLYQLQHILASMGHETLIYGAQIPKKHNKTRRKLLLPCSTYNLYASTHINKLIQEFQPNVLRWHSCSRRLGHLPLARTSNFQGKQWMTYHDMGYFHPFPSAVEHSTDIPERNRKAYKETGKAKNPLHTLALRCKYKLMCYIQQRLSTNIDTHFVPSSFMKPIVENWLDKDKKGNILTLPHFLRH